MLPLAGMLFNVVAGLVVDKAQDLAKDHVEKMIDDVLPDKERKEINKISKEGPDYAFDNAKDAWMGAVEGKLPVKMKDGKLLPIERTVKVKFDPNTQKLEVIT